MGEYAELALEFWTEDELEAKYRRKVDVWLKRRESSTHWHCKDGTVLLIAEMEERHVRNCLAMLERAGQTWTNAYKALADRLTSPQPSVNEETNE